jgi:hypothetical protein
MGTRDKKTIAVVLYPRMTTLDLVGALEALIILDLNSPCRLVTVGERTEPVQTDTPLQLVPNQTFAQVPAPFALLVPGGGAAALAAARDEPLRRYVGSAGAGRRTARSSPRRARPPASTWHSPWWRS